MTALLMLSEANLSKLVLLSSYDRSISCEEGKYSKKMASTHSELRRLWESEMKSVAKDHRCPGFRTGIQDSHSNTLTMMGHLCVCVCECVCKCVCESEFVCVRMYMCVVNE